jgi:hypothetical protein
MPASKPRILAFLSIALAFVAGACEPREAADVEGADRAQVEAETATPDTSVALLAPGPRRAVTCASTDTLELGDGASGTLSLPPQAHGHKLIVQAGTVPTGGRVTFTMRDVRASYVAVDVTATGGPATFNPPVTLRLSYAGCEAPDTANLRIYRRNGGSWDSVPGFSHDTLGRSVSVDLTELSQYALGAG